MEKVSIVIPVFNGSNYLKSAIDSALAQTYENCEVIVVNDGSTDAGATAAIAKLYGDRIRYYEKTNGGVATAVNLGIKKMEGDYFAWLSHDDMFKEDKIEKQMNAIKASGIKEAICHCNFDFLYVEDKKIAKINWLDQYTAEQLVNSSFAPVFLAVHGSTVLIHKNHFQRVGNYREDLRATQDSEFLFRVMRGEQSVFVEESLMISRIHKAQGQQTMSCHKREYNEMFLSFCEQLTEEEMISFAGSVPNFYYRLYLNLKNSKPADEILNYLRRKLKSDRQGRTFSLEKICSPILADLKMHKHKIVAFGAGQMGGELYALLRDYGIQLDAFVDNAREKWGKLKEGVEIREPSCLENNKDAMVIISMMDTADVRRQLEKIGITNIVSIGEIKKMLWNVLPMNIEL